MSTKKLNLLANGYFLFILISGLLYTLFLIVATTKIIPGFLMQIIFVLDAWKLHSNVWAVILTQSFFVNTTAGLVLLWLLVKYIKAATGLVKGVRLTAQFLHSLSIGRVTSRYITFHSSDQRIFTVGFVFPRVYVATSLFKTHTSEEMEAMLLHEQNHQKNHHPLKIFIVSFIDALTPKFPSKSWLVNHFLTLTEITSDQFSQDIIKTKKPLVTALYKLQESFFTPSLSTTAAYFNSQSERIKILTGKKVYGVKKPLVFHSVILSAVLLSLLATRNTTMFFDCKHLLNCVEALMAPVTQSQTLLTPNTCDIKPVSMVDHCK